MLIGLLAGSGLVILACGGDTPRDAVHVSELDNDIGPVTANFIDRALDRAEDNDATAWILQLDTPGGLLSATDDMVQRIEAATVPVVVFVSPLGARAASAGTFITLSAHIAAMAPNTQIGAATPVGGGGEDIEGALGEKITNDAAADIRGIAQLRGRNEDWAERAVREAISATAEEAVALNVVDLVANDLADLLAQIDGRRVVLKGFVSGEPAGPEVTIHTQGAAIVQTNMNFFENVLDFVADPNIALLLISLGGLALLIEIISPGLVGPGVFGVIALLVGFFGLGALDTNPAGLALLALAFVLFVAEIFVAGFGFLGIGGIIAFFFGGLLLISETPDAPEVSLWVLVGLAAMVAAVLTALWAVILTDRRRQKSLPTVEQRMLGETGLTRGALDPDGTALVASEVWSARSSGAAIPADTTIRVVGVDGLCLLVEPVAEAADAEPAPTPPAPPADAEQPGQIRY
ncbi:MAG: nodulation protein NfeD [Dehalococcoidia bacterium]